MVQYAHSSGSRAVAALDDDGRARRVTAAETTFALARRAIAEATTLEALARDSLGEEVDLRPIERAGGLLPAIDHPDPAHLFLTGTGLTHLGSAEGRDKMHRAAAGERMTDSMRMFRLGLEGGKPANGPPGAQPEWFYKGTGAAVVPPGAPLLSPSFALDGSEEPEIAGVYLIDEQGTPRRLGFALANEFSDHVTEQGNYLWLAHSKLRPVALGAELLLGPLPESVEGVSRIRRDGRIIWEKPFLSGEANMSHSIANLEHHHFKYAIFRQPGDAHVHFFGTATLSFADGIRTQPGDEFEIMARPFLLPLRNRLAQIDAPKAEALPL
ncbi:MAG: GguC family protein [Amphiplicatus sp.]